MITENLDVFFADFGVSFTAGAVSGKCLFNMPGMEALSDRIIETDFTALVKTSEFGSLLYNNAVTVAGVAYVVKVAKPVEDGVFTLITLEKV